MAQFPAALTKLGESARSLTLGQRTVAIIGVAVLALGAVVLTTIATQPRMSPLYTGLDPADASAIVEQLRTDGIAYELTAGGTSVMVPEANVYDARLKAASAGLPTSAKGGYSLLDDMGVTSSEFQQSVTYKRAIEGELASTIQALDGVQTASVKLAIPEETVFVDEVADPTASVFVSTNPGTSFTNKQVQSVVHLVSAAVDGMEPENVAVVDASGELLSAVGVGAAGGTDEQASEYEKRVSTAVQSVLDEVIGRGNATVAVAADVNLESAKRLEESFEDPGEGLSLTESTVTEEYEGTGGGMAGVLGPDNIAVPNNAGGDGTYTSEKIDRSNAVNKVTENREIPAGTLKRQTISVAVDSAVAGTLDVAELETMVANAAGFSAARGDQLSVSVVPFSTADEDAAREALAAAEAAAEAEREAELVRTLVVAGVIVLAMVLCVAAYLAARRRRQPPVAPPVFLGEAQNAAPALASSDEDPVTAVISAQEARAALVEPPAELETDASRRRADLNTLATQDPAKVAEHLRTLMDVGSPE